MRCTSLYCSVFQCQMWPYLMAGKDIIGIAQTGKCPESVLANLAMVIFGEVLTSRTILLGNKDYTEKWVKANCLTCIKTLLPI